MSTKELYQLYKAHPHVFTDTRKPVKGGIYFALSGPNFNGNLFAKQALELGAAHAIVDQAPEQEIKGVHLVPDVLKALQDLALFHRRQLKCQVLGITGSNGKTTTKELVAMVLSQKYKTHYTQGNLNNHIGVPLTILSIDPDAEIAVIEMGASKPKDIQELCEIAEPDYGLITNIGKAHLEGMGGYEGVVKTKTELYDSVRNRGGLVFVNTDHAVFVEQAEGIKQFRYGKGEFNDVRGEYLGSEPFVRFRWSLSGSLEIAGSKDIIQTRLMGYYNFENILAAVAVGVFFKVPDEAICKAVSNYVPDNNRSQLMDTGRNRLVMDAYNANPTSMEAALLNFSALQAGPKMVILGKMMELGETSLVEHTRIAEELAAMQVDIPILVGEMYTRIPEGVIHFNQVAELVDWLKAKQPQGYTILIKGSRANRLEQLTSCL